MVLGCISELESDSTMWQVYFSMYHRPTPLQYGQVLWIKFRITSMDIFPRSFNQSEARVTSVNLGQDPMEHVYSHVFSENAG